MKKGRVIKSLLIATSVVVLSDMMKPAFGTLNLAARCKENFIGQVISIEKSQAPLSSFPKIDVEFAVDSDEASEKDSRKRKISVVRDGPHKFEIGQIYNVGLNQGFICRLERRRS